jgi:hypothetical protein
MLSGLKHRNVGNTTFAGILIVKRTSFVRSVLVIQVTQGVQS